jgi:creatinine amidohydrolase
MKPPTVFMGEMTSPEVEVYMARAAAAGASPTVIVPTGSTEQHGPHGALLTDMLIAQEVARRAAPSVGAPGALVAPSINYALSYPHVGFTGLVHIKVSTFMSLIEDLCHSLASIGFRRIVFLNGHYDNTYAIAYACATARSSGLPESVVAFPINYWDGLTPDQSAEFFGAGTGLHANQGETSAVLAINPDWVDLENANFEMPPFPEVTNSPPVHTAFFFSNPGSVYRASQSGSWGDGRGATAEFGERYLTVMTESTVRVLNDIERTYEAMPPR